MPILVGTEGNLGNMAIVDALGGIDDGYHALVGYGVDDLFAQIPDVLIVVVGNAERAEIENKNKHGAGLHFAVASREYVCDRKDDCDNKSFYSALYYLILIGLIHRLEGLGTSFPQQSFAFCQCVLQQLFHFFLILSFLAIWGACPIRIGKGFGAPPFTAFIVPKYA